MTTCTTTSLPMLALSICLGCGGTLPPNTLEIKKPDGTAAFKHETIIPSAGVLLEEGTHFTGVILADPGFGAATVSATYQSGSYRSEADLYALDPRPLFGRWDANAFDPVLLSVLNGGTLPKVFPLASPKVGSFDPPKVTSVTHGIPRPYFFPGAQGSTHLRDVLFHNYGWCANEISFQEILGIVGDEVLKSIQDNKGTGETNLYSFVTFDGTPTGGGFLLYISADIPTVPGVNVSFKISRRYLFELRSGILGVFLDKAQDDISKFSCHGGGANPLNCPHLSGLVRGRVLEALDGGPGGPGLPARFHDIALDRQSVRVVPRPEPGDAHHCLIETPSCPDSASTLAAGLGAIQGLEKMAQVFSLSTEEKDQLRGRIDNHLKTPSNWRCAPDRDTPGTNVCKLIARADGLNVFPDALQVVLMGERSSGTSSGAAATALAYTDASGGTVASACNAQHGVDVGPGLPRSSFVRIRRATP